MIPKSLSKREDPVCLACEHLDVCDAYGRLTVAHRLVRAGDDVDLPCGLYLPYAAHDGDLNSFLLPGVDLPEDDKCSRR